MSHVTKGPWKAYGDAECFVRRHPNADGREWYQAVRVSWPDDTDGHTYILQDHSVDIEHVGVSELSHAMYVFGLDDVDAVDFLAWTTGYDLAWMLAEAGELDVDHDLPFLETDDAGSVNKALAGLGIDMTVG